MKISQETALELVRSCELADRWLTKLIEDKDFSPCDETLCHLLETAREKIRISLKKVGADLDKHYII